MPLCSVVPRALHPGAPGSGGGWRGANRWEEQAVFICVHLFTDSTLTAESSCCQQTDIVQVDEDRAWSSPEGLQLHPRVQELPGPRRGGCRLRPGSHQGTLYLRDQGHGHALFFQQEPQPQELDFSVSMVMPKYERDLIKQPWLLRLEDLMADPAPGMQKPPDPAGP